MPSEPQDITFPILSQEVPVNYYDPEFFSQLQSQLHCKIANKSIALLPDIEETFTYSQDKWLSDKAFMQKLLGNYSEVISLKLVDSSGS